MQDGAQLLERHLIGWHMTKGDMRDEWAMIVFGIQTIGHRPGFAGKGVNLLWHLSGRQTNDVFGTVGGCEGIEFIDSKRNGRA
jgi:hypothetical protein